MGGLGAILAVRDGLKDAQYERQDLMRKYEESITERTLLKEKVAALEAALAQKQKAVDSLQTENDNLQDDMDNLQQELQKRETISGIGSIALQKLAGNIVRRNPERVSRLLGISPEDMLGMINGEEEPQTNSTQPTTIPTVEVQQDDAPSSATPVQNIVPLQD